jgi:hypothetical protein
MTKRLLFRFFIVLFVTVIPSTAQDGEILKLLKIKPMVSTTADVLQIFGQGKAEENSTWYYFDDKSIEVIVSDGECTEGWLAPKDTVIEASAFFFSGKRLSELKDKVNLTRLRVKKGFDVAGEKHYFDDVKGIKYEVNDEQNIWSSVTYYPSHKYSKRRCED